MSKKRKTPPAFKTEAQARAFWESHDSSDYVDWSKAERARFPNLKPSTKAISLRLPIDLLERIKTAANKRDVPYQSLIKVWLAEKLDANWMHTKQRVRERAR
jgi:predicted DNA binding CopG/RHH family protein